MIFINKNGFGNHNNNIDGMPGHDKMLSSGKIMKTLFLNTIKNIYIYI